MYIFKIAENISNSKWYTNGGNLVIKSILEGNIDGINADGTFSKVLSDEQTKGIDLLLEHPHKVFTSQNPFGIRIVDYEDEEDGDKVCYYLQDSYKIKENSTWGFLSDIEAMELLQLCYRVKSFNSSLIELCEVLPSVLRIVRFNNYNECYSYEDKSVLSQYCIDSNGKGAFVFLEDLYVSHNSSPEVIPELDKFSFTRFQCYYSEPEWMMLKYFIK